LLADLPEGVDPWRERRVSYLRGGGADVFAAARSRDGRAVERDGYGYCDLVMESPFGRVGAQRRVRMRTAVRE
jgi:hypothetical protein